MNKKTYPNIRSAERVKDVPHADSVRPGVNGEPRVNGTPRLYVVNEEEAESKSTGVATPRHVRLPGYDASTQRVESAAFFMLEFIGAALILVAAGNALRYSEQRDSIAAALSSGTSLVKAGTGAPETNHVLTNLTVVPPSMNRTPLGVSLTSHPS